ncbi:MAG TPA: sigma factor [Burkholderiaceae bacterium]|nr:sigma factor [Burkholderiaceae bacterium]
MEAAPFDHAAALIACARGDQAAFHQLYDNEAPHMLALCKRLVPSDAEGLLHDTFVLIWRNADQYDPAMGPARPWIYSVLRHLAHNRRVQSNAVPPIDPPPLPPASSVRGRLAQLATNGDTTAFEAVAHAYLHGADYGRLSAWLRHDEAGLRQLVRNRIRDTAA